MSWFNDVFGFEESDYAETQARFFQEGPFLHTRSQPSVSYRSGILTMPESGRIKESGQQSCDRTVWKVQI
uniref:Uncharacterized protein n=2 Tax=Klebsiella pneumoniae TaxID=573 RepID=A0A6C0NDB6_KLEPN|nr:hypothetical protein [Klebsiella pneumoniae]